MSDLSAQEQFSDILIRTQQTALEAGLARPDVIVLPELFAHCVVPSREWAERAEELNGETVSTFADVARRLECMILCPILERRESRIHNSAVFISADGKVIDCYRKMYPTIEEIGAGIFPGKGLRAVDSSIGRIATLICYDLNFQEVQAALRDERPGLIFFTSLFRGGLRAKYLALECASYVVVCNSLSHQVINPLGRLLNKAGSRQESFRHLPQFLEEIVNMDFGIFHLDYNSAVLRGLRNKYAGKIRLEVAQAEGVFLLESHSPEISVSEIKREFGLESSLDYYDRARASRSDALENFGCER